ncbi:hypothetical protein NL676_028982 [Syzygium grande]|nr:hypothetical protein NL676_028982 [Syzygium grande]
MASGACKGGGSSPVEGKEELPEKLEPHQETHRAVAFLFEDDREDFTLLPNQSQGSPATPVNSHSSSVSDPSAPWVLSEELDTGANQAYYSAEKEHAEPGDTLTVRNHEMRILEINTLEWDELVTDDPNNLSASKEVPGRISCFEPPNTAESVTINN